MEPEVVVAISAPLCMVCGVIGTVVGLARIVNRRERGIMSP